MHRYTNSLDVSGLVDNRKRNDTLEPSPSLPSLTSRSKSESKGDSSTTSVPKKRSIISVQKGVKRKLKKLNLGRLKGRDKKNEAKMEAKISAESASPTLTTAIRGEVMDTFGLEEVCVCIYILRIDNIFEVYNIFA